MDTMKVRITDEIISNIVNGRKNNNMTSYDTSEAIGKSKFWLTNIESGKQKTIKYDELKMLFCFITHWSDEEVENHLENVLKAKNEQEYVDNIISENTKLRKENEILRTKIMNIMKVIGNA